MGKIAESKRNLILLMVCCQAVFLLVLGLMFFSHVSRQYEEFTEEIGTMSISVLTSESKVDLLYNQNDTMAKRLMQMFKENKWLEYAFVLKKMPKEVDAQELNYVDLDDELQPDKADKPTKPGYTAFAARFRNKDRSPLKPLVKLHLANRESTFKHNNALGLTRVVKQGVPADSPEDSTWGYVCIGISTSHLDAKNEELVNNLLVLLAIMLFLSSGFIALAVKRIRFASKSQ